MANKEGLKGRGTVASVRIACSYELMVLPDHIRRFFRQHINGRHRMLVDHNRRNRVINNPQTLDVVDPETRVDDAHVLLRAHCKRSALMSGRNGGLTDVALNLHVRLGVLEAGNELAVVGAVCKLPDGQEEESGKGGRREDGKTGRRGNAPESGVCSDLPCSLEGLNMNPHVSIIVVELPKRPIKRRHVSVSAEKPRGKGRVQTHVEVDGGLILH